MDEDAAVGESPPTSPARSVRARAASPPAAERKEEVDISKHVAMMRARSRENDLEGAMQVFRKLQSTGVQLTALVYNTLLKAYLKQGQIAKARKLLAEMAESSIQANQD